MAHAPSWWKLAAIVVGGTVALTLLSGPAGRLWTRLRPGSTLVFAIDSAHPFDEGVGRDEARRRTLDVLRNRLDKLAPGALVAVTGDRVAVTLPRGDRPGPVARLLTRTGRLEFKLVDDGSAYMTHVAEELAAQRLARSNVDVAHDEWIDKAGTTAHDDIYLVAPDRESLQRTFAALAETLALQPPADHSIAFERKDAAWRSYYLYTRTELTGDAIQDLEVSWDQQTGRPEVSISFDADGAKRFEATTARAVGRKLAILLEGTVQSAPVIESKIAGGHARVTMGGYSDPSRLQEEAKDLVAVLRSGGTAAPVALVESR